MNQFMSQLPDYVAALVFGLYSLGLLVMFVWTVVSVWKGRIRVFSAVASRVPAEGEATSDGVVSLSKLQMFLWTLVLVFAWLYQLVRNPGEFPVLPNQALLLMGLSGAAYLGAKQQGANAARDRQRAKVAGGGV